MGKDCLAIAMVSDFFYPNVGGVESHIYQLSQCLIQRGHRIVVITHAYGPSGERGGVRYMPQGLKVYYLPFRTFYNQCVFPTILGCLPVVREVLIREEIDIVHGHSAFSTLAHETMFTGRCLGLRAVFTDHSLFGFADLSSILTNKVLRFSLADADHMICVSHTSKENTVLRANLDPARVYVIPNAVDATVFTPDPTKRDSRYVTVVVVSRLVYRKGTDLLGGMIPYFCEKYPNVRFIIGGDGPKRLVLEEVREKYQLHNRVQLLGGVPHDKVRDVLVKGDIFVNTSLTEAFCIAIVEAVCCGLQVVSTNVGGVPEVLPPDLITLADPSLGALTQAVEQAIVKVTTGTALSPYELHRRAGQLYTWPRVADRTERVYRAALDRPQRGFKERLMNINAVGPVAGKVFGILCILHWLLFLFLCWFKPDHTIDKPLHVRNQLQEERDK